MSEAIVEFLKEINIGQLIAMAGMFWFFYTRLDSKMDKRFEKLEAKVEDVDRRLCRIEGSLATQGHCLFSHHTQSEKVAE
ncbi:MAG: hypothetical protein JSR46_07835 [Verrucomicrobia bacterium]|nr:hypothetical protein [Verrucomicrobiota bacterium]